MRNHSQVNTTSSMGAAASARKTIGKEPGKPTIIEQLTVDVEELTQRLEQIEQQCRECLLDVIEKCKIKGDS